eukprot:793737-Pelagomonas_calceolata.AAC.4
MSGSQVEADVPVSPAWLPHTHETAPAGTCARTDLLSVLLLIIVEPTAGKCGLVWPYSDAFAL